jgi:hypothetical protein
LSNLGGATLGDGEAQVDPVSVNRGGRGHHLCTIKATADVLPLEFLLGFVSQGLVIRTPFCQAHFLECFGQNILVKFFEANELHCRHRRTLFDHHHQHIALGFKAHILEQAQREQGANACGTFVIGVLIAHPQRQ